MIISKSKRFKMTECNNQEFKNILDSILEEIDVIDLDLTSDKVTGQIVINYQIKDHLLNEDIE